MINKLLDYLHPKFKAGAVLGAIVALGLKALQTPGPNSVHLTGFEQSALTLVGALLAAFVKSGPKAAVVLAEQNLSKVGVLDSLQADLADFKSRMTAAHVGPPTLSPNPTTVTIASPETFTGNMTGAAPLADVGEVAPVNLPPVVPPAQPPAS